MKTMSKKLASIVLALCLCFSLVGTALAATSSDEGTTFSITVTNAANGETYNAYKIFDVTYSYEENDKEDGNYSYTIDSNSPWYNAVNAATNVFTLTQVGDSTTYVVTVNEGVKDDEIIAVFTEANIDLSEVTPNATAEASNGTAVLDVTNSGGAGYYYVTTSLGSLVIIDTTNPTQEIDEKNGTPSISKWVHENTEPEDTWGHEDDASNGELILFEIEIDSINGAVNLVVHDSMDDELEIPNTSDFHISATLYLTDPEGDDYDESTDKITLVEGTDYTITIGNCSVPDCNLEGCAFEIHFSRDFSDVDSTGYIEFTYELLLNTEGDAYEGDYDELVNHALLTYGNASMSEEVTAETYSFGFETYKYTGDIEAEEDEALAGVEFELKNSVEENAASAWFLKEDIEITDEETGVTSTKTIYLFEGWTQPTDDGNYTQTLVTGEDGMIYIEGLDTGTYYLEETKALDGYNPLTDLVTVTIEATYEPETGAMTGHTVTYTYGDETSTGTVNIENSTGTILPGTGGMGTTIFYIIGGVLVAGAVVVLITRRRMSSNEG